MIKHASARLHTGHLLLAVVGLALPWRINVRCFAAGGGRAPRALFGAGFANPLTTAITLGLTWRRSPSASA